MNVTVTSHALRQALDRRHFGNLGPAGVNTAIADHVSAAIAAGRQSNAKPPWLRLGALTLGRRWRPCDPGSWCCWDASERLAWIYKRDGDAAVVITCLHRVVPAEACAA